MKTFINLVGLGGFSALCAGCYLHFGSGTALMLGGSLSLLFALVAAKNSRGT
ncbi:hypothetical protein [Shewanella sp. NFH-SH190041]|uniref:hypothetical protein n=1 Tax=Shewanella sp. NFH-SH190041 TaxID=2950245 RepID=UPI0021C2CD42|nr:hypothetical protein [Shewanella sp. NFH-SH190041]